MIKIEVFRGDYCYLWEDMIDFLNNNHITKDQIIKIKEYDNKHGVTVYITLIYEEYNEKRIQKSMARS